MAAISKSVYLQTNVTAHFRRYQDCFRGWSRRKKLNSYLKSARASFLQYGSNSGETARQGITRRSSTRFFPAHGRRRFNLRRRPANFHFDRSASAAMRTLPILSATMTPNADCRILTGANSKQTFNNKGLVSSGGEMQQVRLICRPPRFRISGGPLSGDAQIPPTGQHRNDGRRTSRS